MTNETQDQEATNADSSTGEVAKNRPTHIAKVRHGEGSEATYEQIGVAWQSEQGALYVKLSGTQIVSSFSLYEMKPKAETKVEA